MAVTKFLTRKLEKHEKYSKEFDDVTEIKKEKKKYTKSLSLPPRRAERLKIITKKCHIL